MNIKNYQSGIYKQQYQYESFSPAKINEILVITKKYGILVLEDAASALGAIYQNQYCGTFGELGVFSFNGKN